MTGSDGSGPDKRDELNIDRAVMTLENYQTKEWAVREPQISEAYEALNAVPIAELEQLVTEWREKAEAKDSDLVGNIQYQLLHERANDLSSLISDYGGTDE